MLPTSLAFAWLHWRQHRHALLFVVGYLLLAAALSAVMPAYCSPGTAEFAVGLLSIIAIASVPLFLLGAFTYGLDGGDAMARASGFPARLFRLPVATHWLVLWPMISGSMATVLLWSIIARLILQPWLDLLDDQVPVWWPAMLAAAALAWVQALSWSPFGLRGLRAFLVVSLVGGMGVITGVSATSGVSEVRLVGVFAGLTLVAWAVGYVGVCHGRRGDAPDWEALIFGPFWQLARIWPTRRSSLSSAAEAQYWFEFRLWGWSLPFCTGLLLIVQLVPLYLGENDVLPIAQTILTALVAPVLLAGLWGNRGGGNNPGVQGRYFGLGAFSATLPLSTADLLAAMLKTAAISSLFAYAVVAVMVPLAVLLTGCGDSVARWCRETWNTVPPAQAVTAMISIAVLLFVATWKRQVDRLYFGLTGQQWIAHSFAIILFPGSIIVCIFAGWLYYRPHTHDAVHAVLPPLLSVLVVGRVVATAVALRNVLQRGLVQPRTVTRWVIAWLLLASLLIVMLAWSIRTDVIPVYYLAFTVLFAMPMARFAAAPLALAWNRHR